MTSGEGVAVGVGEGSAAGLLGDGEGGGEGCAGGGVLVGGGVVVSGGSEAGVGVASVSVAVLPEPLGEVGAVSGESDG